MGNKLVNSLLPDTSEIEGGEGDSPLAPVSYSHVFWQNFPYYLSIGMTESQYWDGDCILTRFYRKAEELRSERANQEAWIQGMYVYDAISRVSPILHAFAKKGTKAQPYVEKPYPLTERDVTARDFEKDKATAQKGRAYMEAIMQSNNTRFGKKE